MKKIAGKNQLNISEIVELFKKEQTSTEVKIKQLMAGGDRQHVKEIKTKHLQTTLTTISDYLTALRVGK